MLSGYTKDGSKRMFSGAGAVIGNYGEDDQFLIGITRGGNSFNPGVTYRDIESDKPMSLVKGERVIDDIAPTITTNAMELYSKNIQSAIPGLVKVPWLAAETTEDPDLANYVRYKPGPVTDGDYLKNVALLVRMLGYADPFVGIIYNAIGGGDIEITLENKNESVVEITFTGSADPEQLEQLTLGEITFLDLKLFEMRWPTGSEPTP